MTMTERHMSTFFDLQNRTWRTTARSVGGKNVEDSGSPGISVEAINAAQSVGEDSLDLLDEQLAKLG
jgi:hypothetical protein